MSAEYHTHTFRYPAITQSGREVWLDNVYHHAHADGFKQHEYHPVLEALEKRVGFPSESEWKLVGPVIGATD